MAAFCHAPNRLGRQRNEPCLGTQVDNAARFCRIMTRPAAWLAKKVPFNFSGFITLFVCMKLSHPRMADTVLVGKSLRGLLF
jgi:hypothetical protein